MEKENIVFDSVIRFEGPPEAFEQFVPKLQEATAKIGARLERASDWIFDGSTEGIWPVPVVEILEPGILKDIIHDLPEIIRDIHGGIRNPHLHVDGKIVLLPRDRFQKVVAAAAAGLMSRFVEETGDYVQAVEAMRALVP
jgi:hypothetical protein